MKALVFLLLLSVAAIAACGGDSSMDQQAQNAVMGSNPMTALRLDDDPHADDADDAEHDALSGRGSASPLSSPCGHVIHPRPP